MSEELLPPSSGPTTRALAYTFDSHRRYAPLIGTVRGYGISTLPDDWVPWFVFDLGLEVVIPFVSDLRRILREGPAWQARRGTEDAFRIAFGWLGTTGQIEPPDQRHDWWQYQIRFADPIHDLAFLRQLDSLAALSGAAEDDLFRMFNADHDFRPIRADMHRADDFNGQFDGYSGEPRWEGGPLISFGEDRTDEDAIVCEWFGGTELETRDEADVFEGLRFDVEAKEGSRVPSLWQTGTEHDGTTELAQSSGQWPTAYAVGSWKNGDDMVWLEIEQGRTDDETILVADMQDVWPNVYPRGSWIRSQDFQAVDMEIETT